MGDGRLRQLERRFSETRSVEDEARYLRARVLSGERLTASSYARLAALVPDEAARYLARRRATGTLSASALAAAALCGHRPAQTVLPEIDPEAARARLIPWIAELEAVSDWRTAFWLASRLLDAIRTARPSDLQHLHVLAAAAAWRTRSTDARWADLVAAAEGVRGPWLDTPVEGVPRSVEGAFQLLVRSALEDDPVVRAACASLSALRSAEDLLRRERNLPATLAGVRRELLGWSLRW